MHFFFIGNARVISHKLDREIIFDKEEIKGNAKLGLTVMQDGLELNKELRGEKISTLTLTEKGGVLNLYGQEIQLPDKSIRMKSVYLMPSKKLESIKKGDYVEFECVPAEGYEYSCKYGL